MAPPRYFLMNKADGNLITFDTKTDELSSEPLDLLQGNKEQEFEVNLDPGPGGNTYTIQQLNSNTLLSHFDGPDVDFNGTRSGAAFIQDTNSLWRFERVDTIFGLLVNSRRLPSILDTNNLFNSGIWKISSVNDSGETCLTADDDKIICKSYTGDQSQLWLRPNAKSADIHGPLQAILTDRRNEIDDLNDQIQNLNEKLQEAGDESEDKKAESIVHGKDAAGWYNVAREIFQNGVTMYKWGPVSTEQESLGQQYWFRGFEANYG